MRTIVQISQSILIIHHLRNQTKVILSLVINMISVLLMMFLFYYSGYIIEDDRLGYNITAYKAHQNCSDMIAALKESLNNIHDILEGRKPSEL